MSVILANLLLRVAQTVAQFRNSEPAVILGESVHIEFIRPNKSWKYCWDDSLYAYGNVFLKDYANAIKPQYYIDGGVKTKLIVSDKFKHFMEMKTIRDAFSGDAVTNKKLIYMVAFSAIANVLLLITIIIIVAGRGGV